jgi:hypothetical protein
VLQASDLILLLRVPRYDLVIDNANRKSIAGGELSSGTTPLISFGAISYCPLSVVIMTVLA